MISDGSDNHLVLIDIKSSCGLTGKEAEEILDSIHITANKNTIPNETESAVVTSGLRVGSAAMTTRGFKEEEFTLVGQIIAQALKNSKNQEVLENLSRDVLALTKKFPII